MSLRLSAAAAVSSLLLLAGGCGQTEEETPAACLRGPAAYSKALAGAPARASLPGDVPISSCLTQNQSAAEITRVGATMLSVANSLNARARGRGGSASAARLGYLIGAAEKGAEDTDGIHANLLLRLRAAATFSPGGSGLPAAVDAAYRAGVDAGRRKG